MLMSTNGAHMTIHYLAEFSLLSDDITGFDPEIEKYVNSQ